MEKLVLLLSLLTVAMCNQDLISERILEAKRVVLAGSKTTVVFYQDGLSSNLEDVLSRVLKDVDDPVIITNRLDIFKRELKIAKHSILFLDVMNVRSQYEIYDIDRRIVVTVKAVIKRVLKQRKAMNELYVICDDIEYPFYHFNRYINKLSKLVHLENDPLATSTKNLAGLPVAKTVERHAAILSFVIFLASCLNTTVSYMGYGISYVSHMPLHQMSSLQQGFETMSMHRGEREFALVPRFNKQIPSIYVITDPFDLPSWFAILASVIAMSMFRVCVTQIFTIRNLFQNFALVLGSFTVGIPLPFDSELDRQIGGLFLLLTVVLINAYQSLIIMYLLSPRFYPELDTFTQLTETCCWDNIIRISTFTFPRRPECPDLPMDAYFTGSNTEAVREAYDSSYCRIVDEWEWKLLNQRPILAMTSGLYRWSNQIVNQKPSIAWAIGDQMIAERAANLGGVYFAEAALYKIAETEVTFGNRFNPVHVLKPMTVDELSLVWIILGFGMIAATVVFWLEKAKKYLTRSKIKAMKTLFSQHYNYKRLILKWYVAKKNNNKCNRKQCATVSASGGN